MIQYACYMQTAQQVGNTKLLLEQSTASLTRLSFGKQQERSLP